MEKLGIEIHSDGKDNDNSIYASVNCSVWVESDSFKTIEEAVGDLKIKVQLTIRELKSIDWNKQENG